MLLIHHHFFHKWINIEKSLKISDFSFVAGLTQKKGAFSKFFGSRADINIYFLVLILYDKNSPQNVISSLIECVSQLNEKFMLYQHVGNKLGVIDVLHASQNYAELTRMMKNYDPASAEYQKISKILKA